MGITTAIAIFNMADQILQDNPGATAIRWKSPEKLQWLNLIQKKIALLKPDSYSAIAPHKLVAGTKQTAPVGATMILDGVRNLGTDGTTAGKVVTLIQRRILDDQDPNWHTTTAAVVVQHWIYEPTISPFDFYVWPPSPGTNYLELCTAGSPADVVVTAGGFYTNPITLADIYVPAILHGILYMAFSKDADYAYNAARAQQEWNVFLQLLGRQDLMEGAMNPHLRELEKVQRTMQQAAKG